MPTSSRAATRSSPRNSRSAAHAESTAPSGSPARNPRELIRRLRSVDSETLLAFFTDRQYINPRETIAQLLATADTKLGICPVAAERAVAWLELNPAAPIGRLRRTELTQLARCLHRFLRHTSVCSPARPSATCPN